MSQTCLPARRSSCGGSSSRLVRRTTLHFLPSCYGHAEATELDSWAARESSANPMADQPCQEFLDGYSLAADQQLALGLERRSERVHAWLRSRPAPALHFDRRQCAANLNYEVDFAIAVPPVEEIAYARGIIWPAYFGSPVTMPATASRSR